MTPPAAQTASPLAPGRRVAVPPRPRRISGPVRVPRPQAPPTPTPRARPARSPDGGLALGLIGLAGRLDSLASHRLLDRLIRSRVWIGIVAFALIGIVTLQLGLLKLNSGIGRALEHEGALQRSNAALAVEDSELASGSRVESQAAQLGMTLSSISGLKFLGSHARGDVPKAAAALQSAPTQQAAPAVSEASGSASEGEASAEASGSSGGSEATAGGEAGTETETASSGGASEAQSSGGSSEGETSSEASSEPVPAGEGGGAAAPGG